MGDIKNSRDEYHPSSIPDFLGWHCLVEHLLIGFTIARFESRGDYRDGGRIRSEFSFRHPCGQDENERHYNNSNRVIRYSDQNPNTSTENPQPLR